MCVCVLRLVQVAVSSAVSSAHLLRAGQQGAAQPASLPTIHTYMHLIHLVLIASAGAFTTRPFFARAALPAPTAATKWAQLEAGSRAALLEAGGSKRLEAQQRSGRPVAQLAKPKTRGTPWKTLLKLCKPDIPLLSIAFISLTIAASGDALLPALQGAALNTALGLETAAGPLPLSTALGRLAAVGFSTALFTGLRGFCFWICGARLVARLRATLFEALLNQPQAFHDEAGPGELSTRLATDCVKLGDVLSLNVNIVLRQVIQSVAGALRYPPSPPPPSPPPNIVATFSSTAAAQLATARELQGGSDLTRSAPSPHPRACRHRRRDAPQRPAGLARAAGRRAPHNIRPLLLQGGAAHLAGAAGHARRPAGWSDQALRGGLRPISLWGASEGLGRVAAHPGAPPAQIGGLPWPQELGSACV